MAWTKQGLIFQASGQADWMLTHAALPVVQPLSDDLVRIHFCSRNANGKAQIGNVEMNLAHPAEVFSISRRPTISLGPLGAFDDSGVTSSCVVVFNDMHFQYFTGWSLGVTVPFYYSIGLAISRDGGATFEKVSRAPIMGRDPVDPFLTASPFVMIDSGVWRMWYVSGVAWEIENGQPKHYYHIKYAESADGIDWRRQGITCIDFASPDEYAIGRPSVLKDGSLYRMWYPYRGNRYRLGYAESADGLGWQRKDDQAGLDVTPDGWDSEMIAYPYVFDHNGRRCMLYNGNGYGKTGIGLAVLPAE